MEPTSLEQERIVVRALRPHDLDAVIALDAKNTGRRREEYFKIKLQQNLAESGVKISLATEIDGIFCAFLLARVYYGEFGSTERTAVLDTLDVHPDFRRQGAGKTMLLQLAKNLRTLGVGTIRTEVGWDNPDLLAFFHREGFRPAPRFCLDLDLSSGPPESDPDEFA